MLSLTRRHFLSLAAAFAAPERGHARITDIRAMVLAGPRTYTLVKVLTDAGVYGIGEGYGSPEVGMKLGVLDLRPYFIGKDPLEIETLCGGLTRPNLHALSAIEIALWDLAGKLLNQPATTLLGGHYRDRIRVYRDEGPPNMLDRSGCNEWADKMKSDPAGWTAFKVDPPRSSPKVDNTRDAANRTLTSHELRDIRQGFEYCRDAIGWDHDLIVDGHGQYDLPGAIQLAEALAPVKPMWLADPLPSGFSASWARLAAASKVPIGAGASLARRPSFKDYILSQGCDIVELDIRNTGGLLESKKIADLAELSSLPVAASNTGSAVNTMATVSWAASVRDFLLAETLVGRRNWMDDVILHEGPIVQQGHIAIPQKPGLGIELNPDIVKANLAAGEKYWE